MRQSKMFIPTTRNVIEDDVACKSLMLMQKAGMIKQVAAGVYTYLPLANLVLKNIEKIVREELEKIDSVEMLMPALQPKELWEESGRWTKYGVEMMRLKDRHEREFCLGPTHEEAVVSAIRDHVKSWRALPLSVYQIQTKFRDEKRPRYGLMRGREFIMKDAYSFHADASDLHDYYLKMSDAYEKIFNRCDLRTIRVSADNGSIGGSSSTEFMSISEIGEDTLVYCDKCGYQANLEKAEAKYDEAIVNEEVKDIELIDTPNTAKIEEIATLLSFNTNRTVKYITYKDDETNTYYLAIAPGNYEINETKLINLVQANDLRLLSEEEVKEQGLVKGYIGAYNFNAKDNFKFVVDTSVTKLINHTAGANEVDKHYINVNYGRDYKADFIGDIKEVKEGDYCLCGEPLQFAKGIEVGHVFELGSAYSKPMKCNYLDQNQKEVPMEMGCYGLGVSRVLMAVVEAHAKDNSSIIWPKELQPFDAHIIIVDIKKEEQVSLAEELYLELKQAGLKVLLDDRKERAGSKFADSDLIGIRNRIIVGKNAADNIVEYINRETDNKIEVNSKEIVKEIIDVSNK